jgi:hypothetical protein
VSQEQRNGKIAQGRRWRGPDRRSRVSRRRHSQPMRREASPDHDFDPKVQGRYLGLAHQAHAARGPSYGTRVMAWCARRPQNGVSEQKIGPCEQRQLLASAGCGTINPANLGASSFAICQRQQSLSLCAERSGEGASRATAMRGGVRRVRSPPWWRRASARARAAGVAQGRRADPTVPRSCRQRCGRY